MSLIIKNCGQILTMGGPFPKRGKQMSELNIVNHGVIHCEGKRIIGVSHTVPKHVRSKNTKIIDAHGKVVMPGFIDCHTHLVFAGNRTQEWQYKLDGMPYLEILKKGGGILSTVRETRKAGKKKLLKNALMHLHEMMKTGITTVEAKSGYGLDLATEIKILEVLREAMEKCPMRIVPTFLGAHALPKEFAGRSKAYVRFLTANVLPKVKALASFVDIFCERNAFNLKESKDYLCSAKKLGFKLKIHGEQMHRLGASVMAAKLGAVSIDHGERLSSSDIEALSKTSAIAVLLPLASLFLHTRESGHARALINAGVPVAVATDFNPGSSPSKNLFLAMTIACVNMGLKIEEVLSATTINAACALDLGSEIGSIENGKKADIVITTVSDYREIPYWYGKNIVDTVIIAGRVCS